MLFLALLNLAASSKQVCKLMFFFLLVASVMVIQLDTCLQLQI